MRRREFIAGLTAWTGFAHAQQPVIPVVAGLRSTPAEPFRHLVTPFREGLGEAGFVEGRDIRVEHLNADNDLARLSRLAAELIGRQPAVIVGNGLAVDAVRQLDSTVPIVFVVGDDPVRRGLVDSLNRPGGSTTGITFFGGGSLDVKRLELLHELVPQARTMGVLLDADYAPGAELPNIEAAARVLGKTVTALRASTRDLDVGFAEIMKAKPDALLVSGSPAFTSRRHALVALTAEYGLPASYDQRVFVEAGGLMSYGTNFPAAFRQAGIYVGRILKGEKPSELPVLQPTTFELAVNLRTAKALGLQVPPRRGDRVGALMLPPLQAGGPPGRGRLPGNGNGLSPRWGTGRHTRRCHAKEGGRIAAGHCQRVASAGTFGFTRCHVQDPSRRRLTAAEPLRHPTGRPNSDALRITSRMGTGISPCASRSHAEQNQAWAVFKDLGSIYGQSDKTAGCSNDQTVCWV